ncbi:MAG: hypothetical protein ABUL50_13245, partial [Rhizobacter sp.]
KPIAFDPYGRRRSRWRMPRWLVLLLLGVAIGAGGLYFAQQRYLPPRLSAADSAELRSAFDTADTARARLTTQLADTAKRLETALAERKKLGDDLSASRAPVDNLRGDLSAVVASLPPDPRGGAVEVRAARFAAKGNALSYDVLLTRERAGGKPLVAALQLTVAGLSARGAPASFAAPVEPVSIAGHEMARGSVTLPEGFKPNQVTVQVLERAGGKALGMRVMLVR